MLTLKVSALTILAAAGIAMGQVLTTPPVIQPATDAQPLAPAAPQVGKLPDGTDSTSKVEFAQAEHDFGKISDQGEVTTKFDFKNNGTGKLVFKPEQKATCGCTAGKPKNTKGEIQYEFAGEGGYIELTFNSHGKRGDIQQRLTVQSYDPNFQPEGPVLTIRAKVKPTITFDPPSVGFGDVMADQVKKVIRINGAKPDFAVPYLSTSKGRYITSRVIETKEVEIDGDKVGQTAVELTLNTGNLPRGNFNAIATARTNDPQYWLADFPISASVVGDLQTLPPRLNVGVIEVGQPFSKTFKVTSRTQAPFKITKIEQKTQLPTALDITYAPVEAGNETAYMVTVKGNGIPNQMAVNATVTVLTDSPTDPVIEVLLSGAVRAAAPAGGQPQPQAEPGVYQPAPTAPATDLPR